MDPRQRRLHIQWSQSERVELLVGGLASLTERFLVPRELLRRRSRRLRDLLEQPGELSSKIIRLPDTSVQTMEDFYLWTSSLQPKIYEHAVFSEVVPLGIFAWRYQISALSNQVTDMIRRNLANGHWQLEAPMVDDIYGAAPAGSPLREVIRAALGGLPRSSVEGEGQAREKWKATFLKHAQLGWDYIEASGSGWTPQDYLSDTCRFHDHQEVSHQEELSMFENQCAYAEEECFPRWEEESMKGQERDGEQERCGADEERKGGELSNEAITDEAKEPVATEIVANGVAREPVEPVIDNVATDPVVNGVTTKPVVNGVATEPVVNGVAMEPVVDDMATEASVTTEASAIDDVTTAATEASMTTETADVSVMTDAVGPVIDDVAKGGSVTAKPVEPLVEQGVDDVATDGSVTTEAAEPDVGVVEPVEPVADDVATETTVPKKVVAKEVVVDGVRSPVAIESNDGKMMEEEEKAKKKRKKKKKKAGAVGQGQVVG